MRRKGFAEPAAVSMEREPHRYSQSMPERAQHRERYLAASKDVTALEDLLAVARGMGFEVAEAKEGKTVLLNGEERVVEVKKK